MQKALPPMKLKLTLMDGNKKSHERLLGPLNDLDKGAGPSTRKHDTTHRVTAEISTMRIQFTSIVARGNINFGLINEANYLNVVGGLQILQTRKGSSRNETGTMTRL
jgi:translation elongation factor EF-Tu-like GTPase